MIKFYFADGTEQVLNPTASFFTHIEKEFNFRGKSKTLSLHERIAKIAADLGAERFSIN